MCMNLSYLRLLRNVELALQNYTKPSAEIDN